MERDRQPAAAAGTVTLGENRQVNRMGFGTMRLPGPRVWGEPPDRQRALSVLRRAVDLGVQVFDTAGYYGDHVSDRLIVEALYPYPDDVVIVTKVGASRRADTSWGHAARPEQIREAIEDDLRALRLEAIDVVHWRYTDPDVPLADSFGALVDLQRAGKVRHIGVSNVSLEQLREAQSMTTVVSVQNQYSLTSRNGEDVLQACTEENIPFMPYFPLEVGKVAQLEGALRTVAERHNATPAQVALAWLLALSAIMLVIPGTGSPEHLEENVAAAGLRLDREDIQGLSS